MTPLLGVRVIDVQISLISHWYSSIYYAHCWRPGWQSAAICQAAEETLAFAQHPVQPNHVAPQINCVHRCGYHAWLLTNYLQTISINTRRASSDCSYLVLQPRSELMRPSWIELPQRVVVLVELDGTTVLHAYGARSQFMRVVAVITGQPASVSTSQHFQVPSIPMPMALQALAASSQAYGLCP